MDRDKLNALAQLAIDQNELLRALSDRVVALMLVNIALMARLADSEDRAAIRADALEALEALGSDARTAAPIIDTLTGAPTSVPVDADDTLAFHATATRRLQ